MKDKTFKYVSEVIESFTFRSKIHEFSSGAIIIDIWIRNHFVTVQLDIDTVGFSVINSESGFSTVPDNSYDNFNDFKLAFDDSIFKMNNIQK